jgi:chromosome segregation and condensation protein ScpB/DNA-binding XRE family transcriptional regulator
VNAVEAGGESGAPFATRSGRRAATAVSSPIGAELRRRREMLRIGIREAARRTGVSHTVISEIENGRRLPTVRTFEKLRRGLGIDGPVEILLRAREPVEALEVHLVRLCACLWASGGRIAITDLAGALGIHATAVREELPLVALRLAACGIGMTDDSVEVRLAPLGVAAPALAALGRVTNERRRAALSSEAILVLGYVGWHREATRRQLEALRGEDCEGLLARLVDAGFLAAVRDPRGPRPNRYRLTAVALSALDVASLEELRAKLAPLLEGRSLSGVAVTGAGVKREDRVSEVVGGAEEK